MKSKHLIVGILLLFAAIFLVACSSPAPEPVEATPCPTAAPCPEMECPTCPECPDCPTPVVETIPFEALWVGSPHADYDAEAFNHWNEDDPAEVPTSCAKCHSTAGYMDFLGAEGSEAGVVDNPAPIGTVIECEACHNRATVNKASVVFPSGVEVTGLDASARCMECHQGRASKMTLDAAFEQFGVSEDVDVIPEPVDDSSLGFINIHYYAAGATLYGTQTMGGYEYEGKAYDFKNDHVAGYDSCVGCHNPHTLELKIDECAVCHTGVASVEDLRGIRMAGSLVDYDGDGDTEEGVASEIAGLQEMLLGAINAYATEVVGTPMAYDAATYPYFMTDAGERPQWTARLLKAAYNYQTSVKDPGQYAHGGKYIIQLLYDSIEDLNQAIASPVDLSSAHRIDAGHFAGSEEAFRHWDEDGHVEAGCARCHSGTGLSLYLQEGVNISEPLANGMNCANCHNDLTTFTRFEVGPVSFPSGASLDLGDSDTNLCLNCHQGRQAGQNIDAAIGRAGVGDNDVSEALRFSNPHYFAAGATLFGADAGGAYEYAGKEYKGQNLHVETYNTCTECHSAHALTVNVSGCANCHSGVETQEDTHSIRYDNGDPVDYDGDGDTEEGIASEISTMHETLYAAMQTYVADTLGTSIVYNSASYPYFFNDSGESYAFWTPRLLRAAYNYQWVAKDPGAFAHNGDYIIQVLYDSLDDIGSAAGMTRPEVAGE